MQYDLNNRQCHRPTLKNFKSKGQDIRIVANISLSMVPRKTVICLNWTFCMLNFRGTIMCQKISVFVITNSSASIVLL